MRSGDVTETHAALAWNRGLDPLETRIPPMMTPWRNAALRTPGVWLPLLLFASLVAYLLFAERALLFGPLVLPTGDSAADDLLVQQALHLRLLHGNYSRFGFYHPGPWFLFVAAAGEEVFYRWTGLFHSYLGAQTFALSLTQAVAFALSCRLWVLASGRASFGLLAVAIIAASIVAPLAPANPFIQLWTPYSTIAASLMAATGLAGCILRGSSWLPLLALGSAQMVHGHASFVGIMPAILVLAALLLALRRGAAPRRAEMTAWVRANRLPLGLSLAIVALFAAPILVQTIRHFPGELAEYARLAGLLPPQRLAGALRTELLFFPADALFLLLLLLPAGEPRVREVGDLRTACLVVFFAAALPGFWYAWRGVDDLANHYLLIWLAPFAGTACVAALLHAVSASRLHLSPRLILLLLATILSAKALSLVAPAAVVDAQSNTALRRALARLLATPAPPDGGRTELVLDPSPVGWPLAWPETDAILAALRRAGRTDFCVSPMTWNLAFGVRQRCDLAHDRIVGRQVVAGWNEIGGASAMRLDRSGMASPRGLRAGVQMPIEDAIVSGLVLEPGWYPPTPGGVWTDGSEAWLAFPAGSLPERFRLVLDGMLLAPRGRPQSVRIWGSGGTELATIQGVSGAASVSLEIRGNTGAGMVTLRLQVMHPVTPRQLGMGGDTRHLGFMLSRLSIVALPSG